jgi:hypothetical protein
LRSRGAGCLLLILGLSQMAGDVLGLPMLKALGAATAAAPAPSVFTTLQGFEPFSTRFSLEWNDRAGVRKTLALSPEVYCRLQGPYNRRNVYGAVLAAGPVLSTDPRTRALFLAVARHGLCGPAPVLRELGVDPASVDGAPWIRYEPTPAGNPRSLPTRIQAPCR